MVGLIYVNVGCYIVVCVDDGIGFYVFDDFLGEYQVGQFGFVWCVLGDNFQFFWCDYVDIVFLDQKFIGDSFCYLVRLFCIGYVIGQENVQIGFGRQDGQCIFVCIWCDDYFGENFDQCGSCLGVQCVVYGDDFVEG